jgi:hypothetical protein
LHPCSKQKRLECLNAYLDGELDAKKRDELRVHLKKCRECQEMLSRLSVCKQLLAQYGTHHPTPRQLQECVAAQLDAFDSLPQPGWLENFFNRFRLVLVPTASLAVVGLGVFLLSGIPHPLLKTLAETKAYYQDPQHTHDFEGESSAEAEAYCQQKLYRPIKLVDEHACGVKYCGCNFLCHDGCCGVSMEMEYAGSTGLICMMNRQDTALPRLTDEINGDSALCTSYQETQIVIWHHGDTVYALASDADMEKLVDLAEHFSIINSQHK